MKDPNEILFAYHLEIMRAILSDNGMDTNWFYNVVQGYLPPNITIKDFEAMLSGKKRTRPELMIRLWYEIRKFCSDDELRTVDFFIQGNLIRFKNAVLHPHRRKPKRSAFDRLKKSQYAFLAEDYSDVDSVE
jgi:hypothetical protein